MYRLVLWIDSKPINMKSDKIQLNIEIDYENISI